MQWIEKRPKSPDANLKQDGSSWLVRVKLNLPDGTVFERKGKAGGKLAARRLRDEFYESFNDTALAVREVTERCRDTWWPAKGRSADTCEQYYQKMRDYVLPVVGEDTPVSAVTPSHWDDVLSAARQPGTDGSVPVSTATLKKIKAVFSSALSCAVAQKVLSINVIKGIPFDPNPMDEADRLGLDVEDLDDDAPAKRMLSDAEVKLILASAKGSLIYPLIVLQTAFGLRIAEALAVRWGDFDWANDELRVRAQVKRRKNPKWMDGADERKSILERVPVLKSKAGRREIHVFPDAVELLKSLPRGTDASLVVPSEAGGLIEPRNAQRALRNLLDRLIVEEKLAAPRPTSHSFRSWRLSHWANVRNLPPSQLMRLAGHTKIETTMKFYVRSHGDSLKQWLAVQPDVPGSPLLAS